MEIKKFKARKVTGAPKVFEIEYEKVIIPGEDGSEPKETQPKAETFHAVPEVPGKWLMEVGASMAGEEQDRIHAINRFLDRVIVADEKKRWERVMSDTDNILDIDLLADIVNWLIDEYNNEERPTERSAS